MKNYRLVRETPGLYSAPGLVDKYGASPVVCRSRSDRWHGNLWCVCDSRGKGAVEAFPSGRRPGDGARVRRLGRLPGSAMTRPCSCACNASDYERDGRASWEPDAAPGGAPAPDPHAGEGPAVRRGREPRSPLGGAAYTGRVPKPRPVVVVLEPDPAHGQTDWSATIFPDGEAAAREFLAARTLVGWKHVRILPIPPQGATMTYIRELDPEYRPADLDNPFRCADCKWEGTWEDCDRVIDHYDSRETQGIICPSCRLVQWVDQDEPDGDPGPEYGTDDLAEVNALRAEQGRRAL